MEFTKVYICILYLVVIICSLIFYLNNYYIIGSLLLFGNVLPGYKLVLTLSDNDEN